MRSLLLSIICLFSSGFSTGLQAQIKFKDLRTIYLQNGWILQGDTSSLDQGKSIKITTVNQQVFTFPVAEVDSISKASLVKPSQEVGVRHLIMLGYLMQNQNSLPGVNPDDVGNFFSLSLQYVASYHTKHKIGFGVGSGINLFNRGYVIPLFADIRADLGKGYIRPHVYGQVGTSFPLYGTDELFDPWGNPLAQDFEARGGLLYEGGAGIKFMAKKDYAFLVSLGYRLQEIEEDYTQWETRYNDAYTFRRFTFHVGFLF